MQNDNSNKELIELIKKLSPADFKRTLNPIEACDSKDQKRINIAEYVVSAHFLERIVRLKDDDKAKFKESIKFHTERAERLGGWCFVKDQIESTNTLKPHANDALFFKFKELSAFTGVVLNSLMYKKNMTYSGEEVLVLMFSKLEDLTDHYEQLAEQDSANLESKMKRSNCT
jgi:hypothetical protein